MGDEFSAGLVLIALIVGAGFLVVTIARRVKAGMLGATQEFNKVIQEGKDKDLRAVGHSESYIAQHRQLRSAKTAQRFGWVAWICVALLSGVMMFAAPPMSFFLIFLCVFAFFRAMKNLAGIQAKANQEAKEAASKLPPY